MAFKDRLKEARSKCGMTQEQVANKIGIAKSTFAGYETGGSEPNMLMMSKIMDVLGVDANFLLQDQMRHPTTLSLSELEQLNKYRLLDDFGQETVKLTIERELKRSEMINSKEKRIAELEATPIVVEKEKDSVVRIYTYLHKIACAGNGFYFDDIPTDSIEAPYREGADFIIGVNGDSMEPTFKDGDLVYVQKRQIVETGEIGVFFYNNECYIKEAGEDGLISHNARYKMIPGTERIQCIGKVLGKVEGN